MVGLIMAEPHSATPSSQSLHVKKEILLDRNSPLIRCAEQRLQDSPFGAIRRVRCRLSEENGVVELVGAVPDFYSKQLAQETIRSLPGVRSIHNHLTVVGSATRRVS